jgi:phosphomannomutase
MDDDQLSVLLDHAAAWRDDDPDPRTRAELEALVSAAEGDGGYDESLSFAAGPHGPHGADGGALDATQHVERARLELADRFAGSLQFGTAGLRGAVAAGPNRMNRAVVIRAAAGLAGWLRAHVPGTAHAVVGYDARRDSDVFARDTAAVLTAAGVTVAVLPRPLPTPVLAFAVRHLGADVGVMVTASHNPPQDNGYKVYLGGRADSGPGQGVQLVPPADREIAAQIAAVGRTLDVPMETDGWSTLDDGIVEDYLDAAVRAVLPGGPRDLDVVLTPLHGVGGSTVVAALTRAGFAEPWVVPQQAAPDPAFPTVAFPNPEEPGAIDLALAAARERGADLVIANDPDADRCAVAVPDPSADGGWRMLRGDEVGALLGEHLLSRAPAPAGAVVANSVVSSELLSRIAATHGVRHEVTLTGFKWIARVPGLFYGYEEALGYCLAPERVRDKDGITAALVIAELAAALKENGRTLLDALDDLARTHGVHATDQLSIRVADLSLIDAAMASLRDDPPATLGGDEVTEALDLGEGLPREGGDRLPPTDGLLYRTIAGARVVVRPSGTEPKLKCYLEAVVPVEAGELEAARAEARQHLAALKADLQERLAM